MQRKKRKEYMHGIGRDRGVLYKKAYMVLRGRGRVRRQAGRREQS